MELQQLSASLEDYIEAIYHIITEKQVARGKDISARLSVSGASVTEALRALSKKGLINYAPYEVITLTEQGRVIAEDVIHRHTSLKQFFTDVLAIEESLAEEGACKIEHTAPPQIIDRMVDFIHFLEVCPRGGKDLISGFANFCQQGRTSKNCASCISHCMDGKLAPVQEIKA
jgi:DtxR family Mn-dependent transcriptional regulator